MRHKFDKGDFLEDLRIVVKDAIKMEPSLIVVPTERDVRTFERNFKDSVNGHSVFCCDFRHYYDGSWIALKPRPKKIFGFRYMDVIKNISADADVVYVTSVGRPMQKEEREHE